MMSSKNKDIGGSVELFPGLDKAKDKTKLVLAVSADTGNPKRRTRV